MIQRFASSVTLIVIALCTRFVFSCWTSSSRICSSSASLSAVKMMISSRRLRNSGLKVRLTSPLTSSSILSSTTSSTRDWKPSPSRFIRCLAPMFDVMMMIVFLKSTVLPSPSVSCPSSKTCSNRLKTSGCAFSTSSSSTTEYGLRFTRSVS